LHDEKSFAAWAIAANRLICRVIVGSILMRIGEKRTSFRFAQLVAAANLHMRAAPETHCFFLPNSVAADHAFHFMHLSIAPASM
jgi:hypothetical protein